MSQVGDLRAALRDNLKTIPGVSVSRFARSNPQPPGFHLWPSEIPVYHKSFGSAVAKISEMNFTVQAFVSFTTNEGPQEMLDEFLDSDGVRSVSQAVESEPTLGGLAHDVICLNSTGYGFLVTQDNREMLTADWVVTVIV